jgi:hypothetical protein
MSSILQARGRAVNIDSAYLNAKQDFEVLGNQDESMDAFIGIPPDPSKAPRDGTKGRTDKEELPYKWYHAPYTIELAKGVGKIVGELGRAQVSNQKTLKDMERDLEKEQKRIDSNPDFETRKARREAEGMWWFVQKTARVDAWRKAEAKALAKSAARDAKRDAKKRK